jgi:hypothetical protein
MSKIKGKISRDLRSTRCFRYLALDHSSFRRPGFQPGWYFWGWKLNQSGFFRLGVQPIRWFRYRVLLPTRFFSCWKLSQSGIFTMQQWLHKVCRYLNIGKTYKTFYTTDTVLKRRFESGAANGRQRVTWCRLPGMFGEKLLLTECTKKLAGSAANDVVPIEYWECKIKTISDLKYGSEESLKNVFWIICV